MPSLRSRILALVLVVVAVFAWWKQPGVQPEDQGSEGPPARRPDYTVETLAVTQMGADGRPDRRLTARVLRHYPDDDSSELEQPRLTLFDPAAPPWLVRSETAWISADGGEVLMRGKVFIDRESDPVTRPLHLSTRELLVKPREEYAETDRPVIATSDSDWLTSAEGARVWFGDSLRIELAGPVRARYFPDGQTGGTRSEPPEETP